MNETMAGGVLINHYVLTKNKSILCSVNGQSARLSGNSIRIDHYEILNLDVFIFPIKRCMSGDR
jgi:hypothetical protein